MSKHLGQHFLKSEEKLRKIAETLEIKNGDTVIEIGPGHGELTDELRIRNDELRIIAVEKDRFLAENLKREFAAYKNIQIIAGDALKILPSLIHNSSFRIHGHKIVGNIPYYITGRLLRVLSELKSKPALVVLTIQKEVAERIIAQPPRMNLLSAVTQFWAEPEIIDNIPKKYFSPPPKVDSAIIRLKIRKSDFLNIHDNLGKSDFQKNYYKFVKILFKQPRKTIRNNLMVFIEKNSRAAEIFKSEGINPELRPQNLDLEQIKRLARRFYLKIVV